MKSASISFISLNTIDQHHSHAIQMHIHHTHEVFAIQSHFRHTRATQTFMDPCGPQHMRHVDIFPYYSLYFSYLILSQKTLPSPISLTSA